MEEKTGLLSLKPPTLFESQTNSNSNNFAWQCPPKTEHFRLIIEAKIINTVQDSLGGSSETVLEINVIDDQPNLSGLDGDNGKYDVLEQIIINFIILLVGATLLVAVVTLSILVYLRLKTPYKKRACPEDIEMNDENNQTFNRGIALQLNPHEDFEIAEKMIEGIKILLHS